MSELPGLFKVLSAYKPTAEIETFVGEQGELFYSEEEKILRISDGVTPGGIPISSGGTGGGGSNIDILGSFNSVNELPPTAEVGDSYLVNQELYVWSGSEFKNLGLVRGPEGFTGSTGYTGSQGEAGTGVTIQGSASTASELPNPFGGNIGDGFITSDTGELYVWDGTQWNNVGEVRGPKGDTGFTGSSGFTGSQGAIGFTGSQGVGILNVEIIYNDLIITYDDSNRVNLGRVVGYDGSGGGGGGGSIDGFTSNSTDIITLDAGYSIVPETDDLQDLGSPTNRFKDVYVGAGSIHVGNTIISSDINDDLELKNAAGDYKNIRMNNIVLGSTATLPADPTTGIVFANGTVQTTSAPKFYSDAFFYFDALDTNRITAGDYLYDYVNGTLFVTSFIPFNGWVTNTGTGYQPTEEFAIIDNVALTGGTGSGAEATVIVFFGEVFEIILTQQGTGYSLGDSLSIDLNDGGSGFEIIVNSIAYDTDGAISDGYLQLFDITVY